MTFDPVQSLAELQRDGLTFIRSAFSAKQCAEFVCKLNALAIEYERKDLIDLGADTHKLMNFFRHDDDLMALVFNAHIDAIMKLAIGEDYVLILTNAINRSALVDNAKQINASDYWHTDSRVIGGRRMDFGFNYIVCTMLEPFTARNGATRHIPKSHFDRSTPDRHGDYAYETITGKAGDIAIMDAGLWHAGGPASRTSRWSIFSMYAPPFMKPYYEFHKMLAHRKDNLSPDLRRLFHFDFIPPLDEREAMYSALCDG